MGPMARVVIGKADTPAEARGASARGIDRLDDSPDDDPRPCRDEQRRLCLCRIQSSAVPPRPRTFVMAKKEAWRIK